jgi:hypothetical protein
LQPITFQYPEKKILRQILSVLGRVTPPRNKEKYWPPVDLAELGQSSAILLLTTV